MAPPWRPLSLSAPKVSKSPGAEAAKSWIKNIVECREEKEGPSSFPLFILRGRFEKVEFTTAAVAE